MLVGLLLGFETQMDERQRIRVSLVTRPAAATADVHLVRVTFQRLVWDSENEISKIEGLVEPALYQEFFAKLSKSIFLEAHEI